MNHNQTPPSKSTDSEQPSGEGLSSSTLLGVGARPLAEKIVHAIYTMDRGGSRECTVGRVALMRRNADKTETNIGGLGIRPAEDLVEGILRDFFS